MRFLYKPTKWISLVSALFFGWAAYVQLTGDPDSARWFLIYGFLSVCSLINLLFRPGASFGVLPLMIGGAALIWGLLLLPEFDLYLNGELKNLFDESIKEHTEIEREVFGLLLVVLFSGYELFHCTLMQTEDE